MSTLTISTTNANKGTHHHSFIYEPGCILILRGSAICCFRFFCSTAIGCVGCCSRSCRSTTIGNVDCCSRFISCVGCSSDEVPFDPWVCMTLQKPLPD